MSADNYGLTKAQVKDLKEAFSLFDKDGDGTIDTSELGTIMKSLGQNPTKKELEELIIEIDTDGNGSIDFDEFLAMMAKNMSTDKNPEEEMKEAFKIFAGKNKTFITLNDLRSILSGVGEKYTEDEMQEMIMEANENADGKVTFEEFKAIMAL